MVSWLLALLAPLALAGTGLEITRVDPPHEGRLVLRVEPGEPASREALSAAGAELRAQVDFGDTVVLDTAPLVPAGEGLVTVLAIDQSGSFARYLPDAWELADRYLAARQPRERVGLTLFGLSSREWAPSHDPEGLAANVAEARAQPARQQETRLAESIRQAARLAHQQAPPSRGGLRQVVVFTDGGEESSTWTADEVAAELRDLDVRVHVVVFWRKTSGTLADRLDGLSRLANATGGTYVQVDEVDAAARAVNGLATHSASIRRMEVGVCAVDPVGPARFPSRVVVDLLQDGERVAWSAPAPYEQVADARSTRPCSAWGADPPDPVSATEPAADPSGRVAAVPGPRTWRLLFAGLAFLATVAAVLVMAALARQRPRVAPSAIAPAAPTPPAAATPRPVPIMPPTPRPAQQVTRPADPQPSSAPLPDTCLVVVEGESQLGRRWPFHRRILRAGAQQDNDVCIDLPEISGHHARFELFPSGDVYVTDAGSRNGTWVRGRRVGSEERVRLQPGDRVALSRQLVLSVERSGPPRGGAS